jgi:arsenite methyltransferase
MEAKRVKSGDPQEASGRLPAEPEQVVEKVRSRYGRIAEGTESGCCGPSGGREGDRQEDSAALRIGYQHEDLAVIPEGANLGLGCGAPIDLLSLVPGETVLDLGSGAGVDAFLAALKVGSDGRVLGIDMTTAMIERARANAAQAGFRQVEFREGRLEALPVEDASIDAVTSNCVINLVPDKAAVFREVARVLRPGGRLVISDILLDGRLPELLERDLLAYVGCVAGAMERRAYFSLVEVAGLRSVRIHKDVDYLAAGGYCLPDEIRGRMDAAGLRVEDLAGKVRSVTFSAVKPAA